MNGTADRSIVPTTGSYYATFAANYGYPAIAGTAWSYGFVMPEGGNDPSKAFMTCTTCHNQHVMYVYKAPAGKQVGSAIAGGDLSRPTSSSTVPTTRQQAMGTRTSPHPPHNSAASAIPASRTKRSA